MNNDQKGECAELLLQHLASGKPFNDNQKQLLMLFHTHHLEPVEEIRAALTTCIRRSAPTYCMTPDVDEGC